MLGFTGAQGTPLGFGNLRDAKLNRKLTIPLFFRNATVVDATIEGLDRSKP